MTRLLAPWFVAATCASLANPASDQRLMHDVRATQDVASMDLAAMANVNLVVFRITPSADSGSAIMPESPGGQGAGLLQEGNWELLFSTRPGGTSAGTYHWTQPMRTHENRLSVDDAYSPFSSSGTIVCEFHAEASGANQFVNVKVLPDEWARQLPDALQAVRAQRPVPRSAVAEMARSQNPILLNFAFERLLAMHEVGKITEMLKRSSRYARSALVYHILTDRPGVSAATAQGVLRRLVGGTSGDEASRFTALGIFAARLLNPGLSESATWTNDLLNTLRSRLIRSGARADPYLVEMFF
jgi:hypothetical protein